MIGVLAIVAILAAAITPVVIRHIDLAALSKEQTDMNAISSALKLQILRTWTIPSDTTWAQSVGSWLSRPPSTITNTPRHLTRLFLLDTSGWLGTTTLPYTQTITGTQAPTNARVLLVSTIATPLPAISSRPTLAAFNDIWNTQPGAKPSTWTTWPGNGNDLVIQRISLDSLFHRLVLVNRDPVNACSFSINGTNTAPLIMTGNNGTISNAFYLDGSVVGLCSSNGTPLTRYVLTRDIGFVFESDLWQGQIGGSDINGTLANNFASQAAAFLNSNWFTGAQKGSDQQGVLLDMYTFMYDYTMWANECPWHFNTHGGTSVNQPPEYSLLDAVGGNSKLLDSASGQNELLK